MSTITLSQLSNNLNTMASRSSNLLPVMRAGRIVAVSEVKDRFQKSTGPNGEVWKAPKFRQGKPLLDKGILRASIVGTEDSISITLGTNLIQAPLMHYGGTVRPKKAKFLTIPITSEAARLGSPRKATGLRPIFGSRGGVLIDANGKVQFVMTKEVRIPPRPFMGWSKEFLQKLSQMVLDYIEKGAF